MARMRALSILPELASGRGTIRRSRMVERQARRCFIENPAKCGIRISQKLGRGNSKRLNSGCLEPSVASLIVLRPISPRMRFPIHLDRQARVAAEEVEHKGSGRMLTPKLQTVGALP